MTLSGDVLRTVEQETGVKADYMRTQNSHAPVVQARQVAAVLMRESLNMTYQQVARSLGRDGHSGVWDMVNRMDRDEQTQTLIAAVKRRLGKVE